MTRLFALAVFSALLIPLSARAQSGFPLTAEELDAYFDQPPRVEVNLRGALLRLAAQASADDEDPTASALLSGLRGVTVRIYPLAAMRDALAQRLTRLDSDLDGLGWTTLVRVRPNPDEGDNEDVRVLVREDGDGFNGMAVMTLDEEEGEAVFVLIDGLITPEQVGRLSTRFGGPDVDDPDADDDNE